MSYTDTLCLSDLLEAYADAESLAAVCACGHTMGAHDAFDAPNPCEVDGCECAEFTEDPDAWRDER